MSTLFWAAFLRPFLALALAVTILTPVRRAVQRRMKDGRLKRLFLLDMDKQPKAYMGWWVGLVALLWGCIAVAVFH